ncbi:hypothetical protein [Devosia sp. Root635]|uniref:hypothetical protein n=1 Tax=Devosia sp. Root635 TaxID=1736575 RepID=UPI0006F8D568|nr:hypothetical protein [Devosia sp. Root635]KRA42098.1 hypothetical protein ASD80_10245 [Devosia sp. Root635]
MKTVVIAGPEPIVYPGDVPGDHDPEDQTIAALIAAVQAEIDGPRGWLGHSLGFQTLSMATDAFCHRMKLPYGPVSTVLNVFYRDGAGEQHTVDGAYYRLAANDTLVFAPGFSFPGVECAPDAVTVEYDAGYSAEAMPANAKHAVIIGVQQLKPLADQSVMVREEDVEGVGSTTYAVSEASSALIRSATERLLRPLWVPVA